MANNIGDITNFKRKVNDGGDTKNFPHWKNYSKKYGDLVGAGLLVVVVGSILITNAVDFFCPRNVRDHDNRDRNNYRRDGRDSRN